LPSILQLAATKQARTLSQLKETDKEFMESARYEWVALSTVVYFYFIYSPVT